MEKANIIWSHDNLLRIQKSTINGVTLNKKVAITQPRSMLKSSMICNQRLRRDTFQKDSVPFYADSALPPSIRFESVWHCLAQASKAKWRISRNKQRGNKPVE